MSTAGEELPFRHDGKVLRVDLAGARLDDTGSVILDIDYSGRPRRGLYFVGPDQGYPEKPVQVWTQGQDEDSRFWFPCFDAPHAKATSEVIATVPRRFSVLSNGRCVASTVGEAAGAPCTGGCATRHHLPHHHGGGRARRDPRSRGATWRSPT